MQFPFRRETINSDKGTQLFDWTERVTSREDRAVLSHPDAFDHLLPLVGVDDFRFVWHVATPSTRNPWEREVWGPRSGNRKSDPRARSNGERPLWSGPGASLTIGLRCQGSVGVAGVPTPFSRRHDAPAGGQGD